MIVHKDSQFNHPLARQQLTPCLLVQPNQLSLLAKDSIRTQKNEKREEYGQEMHGGGWAGREETAETDRRAREAPPAVTGGTLDSSADHETQCATKYHPATQTLDAAADNDHNWIANYYQLIQSILRYEKSV